MKANFLLSVGSQNHITHSLPRDLLQFINKALEILFFDLTAALYAMSTSVAKNAIRLAKPDLMMEDSVPLKVSHSRFSLNSSITLFGLFCLLEEP